MTFITKGDFREKWETIKAIFAHRSVTIGCDSQLNHLLQTVEDILDDSEAQKQIVKAPMTDEDAAGKATYLLNLWHVGYFLEAVCRINAPKLNEKLQEVASYNHGDEQQEEQFEASLYEIICAGDFANVQLKPSFISSKKEDRHQYNVEFLLKNKHPVECKRPRHQGTLIPNVRNAKHKIEEREQTKGIISISLDSILSRMHKFEIYNNEREFENEVNEHFSNLICKNKSTIMDGAFGGNVIAVLFHFKVLACVTEEESVDGPLHRWLLDKDGNLIGNSVFDTLKDLLH